VTTDITMPTVHGYLAFAEGRHETAAQEWIKFSKEQQQRWTTWALHK